MKHFFHLSFYLLLALYFVFPAQLKGQNALNFDGVNDYVQTTYPGVLSSANRTFEAWIYLSSSATGNQAILDYGLNAVASRNTFLVGSNKQLSFIAGGTNTNISSGVNDVPTDVWTHVALVMDFGTGYLYVNGVQVGTGSLSSVNTPAGNGNLRIGQRVAGGNIPFLGSIDEVRVWDVARTATEIQDFMNTEFCVAPSSLKAYYKFNQGIADGANATETILTDNSGNGNDGVLNGFALTGTSSNWATGATLTTDIANAGTATVSACVPYTSLGNQTITADGLYQDTVVMATGCDSIYTLDFTALSSSFSSMNATSCVSYTTPGGQVLTSSGTYEDTLVNAIGCDSIITINLTINNATTGSINVTTCSGYTSPAGNVYTASGVYEDTLVNALGCDSLLAINLTIQSEVLLNASATVCGVFTAPSGNVYTSSGIYQDTVSGGTNCDTIYTIDLTVNDTASTVITESACGSYVSNMGNTYTTSGTFTETDVTVNGCDSVLTLNLNIITLDTNVTQNNAILTADQSGASYQWYDCADGSAISGATGQTYTATATGSYYVEIQNGACTANSACIDVLNVGIRGVVNKAISLYPNPSLGLVSIDLGDTYEEVLVQVVSADGRIVKSLEANATSKLQVSLAQAVGLYTVLVYTEAGYQMFKVLKLD